MSTALSHFAIILFLLYLRLNDCRHERAALLSSYKRDYLRLCQSFPRIQTQMEKKRKWLPTSKWFTLTCPRYDSPSHTAEIRLYCFCTELCYEHLKGKKVLLYQSDLFPLLGSLNHEGGMSNWNMNPSFKCEVYPNRIPKRKARICL